MNGFFRARDISLAIPTYRREQVLLHTLGSFLEGQREQPGEVLVLDQTPQHEAPTERALAAWNEQGAIRWLRLPEPGIPGAMNTALLEAAKPLVLFVDDDVVPSADLVATHAAAYREEDVWAVAGQVLQPFEEPVEGAVPPGGVGLAEDLDFPFNSSRPCPVRNCMAGNLSVRRLETIRIGGFDENFGSIVAYRFETEFARRAWRHGGKVLFEPKASLRHLRVREGGSRTSGDHLRTVRPDHSMGDYYFALLHGARAEVVLYILRRLARSTATRFHLRHPWGIVPTWIAELRGLLRAMRLATRGQKLLDTPDALLAQRPITNDKGSHPK